MHLRKYNGTQVNTASQGGKFLVMYILLWRVVISNPMGGPNHIVILMVVTTNVHPRECRSGREDAKNA